MIRYVFDRHVAIFRARIMRTALSTATTADRTSRKRGGCIMSSFRTKLIEMFFFRIESDTDLSSGENATHLIPH